MGTEAPLATADPSTSRTDEFAADVRTHLSLSPRQLPSRYLYDELGSALFDAICRLPWYTITRAERGLLERHGVEVMSSMHPLDEVVELGGGSGEKLAILLAARRSAPPAVLRVHLIDVSRAALDTATRSVAGSGVEVITHQTGFIPWLERMAPLPDGRRDGRRLALLLGSNIGNFDRAGADALLRLVRARLRPGDGLLIGADLLKSEADLLRAYDDPLGLTAAFNRNLIVRINRELGSRIDVAGFRHRAVWNARESRVEMHLVCAGEQRIVIPRAGLDFTMRAGEGIWTESSHKYDVDDLGRMFARSGLRVHRQWFDDGAAFALTLVVVPDPGEA